jgi:hypothetical protein
LQKFFVCTIYSNAIIDNKFLDSSEDTPVLTADLSTLANEIDKLLTTIEKVKKKGNKTM